jgi:hypothetical protein
MRYNTGRPKEYMKGPDTASKTLRTQQRYAKANRTQSKLDNFLVKPAQSFMTAASSSTPQEQDNETFLEDEVQYLADTPLSTAPTSRAPSPPQSTAPPSRAPSPPPIIPRTRTASILSDPADEPSPPLIVVDNSDEEMEEDDPNDWDAVLDDIVDPDDQESPSSGTDQEPPPSTTPSSPSAAAPGLNIRSWHTLCEKIKGELRKKNLPLTKYNQLLILRNFATLRIKGFKRIAASPSQEHYSLFRRFLLRTRPNPPPDSH